MHKNMFGFSTVCIHTYCGKLMHEFCRIAELGEIPTVTLLRPSANISATEFVSNNRPRFENSADPPDLDL